jgi:hypothetical protein
MNKICAGDGHILGKQICHGSICEEKYFFCEHMNEQKDLLWPHHKQKNLSWPQNLL